MEQIKQMNELYTSIKGVTASLESKRQYYHSSCNFDYSVVKFEDLKKLCTSNFSGDGSTGKFQKLQKKQWKKLVIKRRNN